jgi:hypothetical protein
LVDPATKRSAFDAFKAPPKAATLGKFKQRLAHLAQLDALGPTEEWLKGLPPGKISHFAGEARVTDVADFVKIKNEAKRLTLLASLIHVLRIAARDEVTEMFCKRMATIHRKGRDRLEELREEHREASERLLEVFGDVLAAVREACDTPDVSGPEQTGDDIPDQDADEADIDAVSGVDVAGEHDMAARTGRLVLKALDRAGGLEQLASAHAAVAAYHGNNYLPLLEAYYGSHRAALFTLVDAIELEATSECSVWRRFWGSNCSPGYGTGTI